VLHACVSGCTDAVIWLSTWGDSTRMSRQFAPPRPPVVQRDAHKGPS
jgi:hypothetical protein